MQTLGFMLFSSTNGVIWPFVQPVYFFGLFLNHSFSHARRRSNSVVYTLVRRARYSFLLLTWMEAVPPNVFKFLVSDVAFFWINKATLCFFSTKKKKKKRRKKKSLTNGMLAEGKGSLLVLENNFIEVTLVLCGDFFF